MTETPSSNAQCPSRLLARMAILDQRVADLEQEKRDLEVMLELVTTHADDLSETLEEQRDDLEIMLDITADHGDDLCEDLEQTCDDLKLALEVTTDQAGAIEEGLQHKAEQLEAYNQFVRDTFSRYASDDVVAQLLDSPEGMELGGEKRTVTIMMSDLRGFTAVAERLDPQEVMSFLNRYLEAMLNVILSYQGTIIEILGDGLMVLFGAPISRPDDPERAVACAISMQLQMERVNALLSRENLPEIEMGIGIHTGDVVVGNIGSEKRTKYGVVGSAVNLTGRMESCTIGSQILISPTTYAATAEMLTIRQALTIEPKGMPEPITIYDVDGIGGEHQLFMPDRYEDLTPLAQEIPVRYTVLQGKLAGPDVLAGRLVKLGAKGAELVSDEPVAALSNLKVTLQRPSGEAVPGELFAKVLGDDLTEMRTHVEIRFTSAPQGIRTFLDAVHLSHDVGANTRWEA